MYVGDMQFGETRISTANDGGGTASIEIAAIFQTQDEADAYVALFPKSLRVRSTSIRWGSRSEHIPAGSWPWVSFLVRFTGDNVQGKTNETGAKRALTYLRKLDEAGIVPVYTVWRHAMTDAETRAFLATQV